MYDSGVSQNDGASIVGVNAGMGSSLSRLLMDSAEIIPGSSPGYELCKQIHAYHPIGAVLTDAPITRAQSKPRELSVPVLGEQRIVEQFQLVAGQLGTIGATIILHNLCKTSRIYGIASLAVGEHGKDPAEPLDVNAIAEADLFFNVLDPLNTAGSLVLNQDPNAADFLKPSGNVHVNGQLWHPSRLFVKMHEQPLYIEWSASAFGFVGRSVYQRALYPLKTFLQTMVTDQMVTQKAGLLVAKMKTPGSIIDNVMLSMFGWKRGQIKAGATGQVLQIGVEEEIQTLNMMNLDGAAGFARTNVLKNIATAAGMPASIIAQETLTEGFGEGTEDAKKEADYLDYIRQDMAAAYAFMDRIIMRKAWTPEFYATLAPDYPEYAKKPYETALHDWMHAFSATWPNLLTEPDSEKIKTADVQFKAVIAFVESVAPLCDPATKAKIISWAADNCNAREELFFGAIDIDEDELREYLEKNQDAGETPDEEEGKERRAPRPFAESA